MKVLALTLSLTYFLTASSQTLAVPEKVYKWTDEKGLIHYSERPPLGKQTEVVKPEIGFSEPVNYGTATSEKPKEEAKATNTKSSLKDPERCDAARQNLDTLKTFARIKVKGEDGEYRFLTPDEQQQRTQESQKAIEESCE